MPKTTTSTRAGKSKDAEIARLIGELREQIAELAVTMKSELLAEINHRAAELADDILAERQRLATEVREQMAGRAPAADQIARLEERAGRIEGLLDEVRTLAEQALPGLAEPA